MEGASILNGGTRPNAYTPGCTQTPHRVRSILNISSQCGTVLYFQAKHIMADEDCETPEEDYADMPGLKEFSDTDCDSETSEEEYEPPKRTKRKRKGRRSQRVRGKKKRSPKKRNKRRRPVARNTTYASKRTCVDPDAVQDLFENQSCGCPKECIKMLKQLQDDGALDVVMQLRKERFACK